MSTLAFGSCVYIAASINKRKQLHFTSRGPQAVYEMSQKKKEEETTASWAADSHTLKTPEEFRWGEN